MGCGCENNNNSKPFTQHSLIEAGKSVIRHFVDPTYDAFTKDDEKNKRLKICESCDQIQTMMGQKRCGVCLCFLEAKAALKDQMCPHPNGDKWRENESQ